MYSQCKILVKDSATNPISPHPTPSYLTDPPSPTALLRNTRVSPNRERKQIVRFHHSAFSFQAFSSPPPFNSAVHFYPSSLALVTFAASGQCGLKTHCGHPHPPGADQLRRWSAGTHASLSSQQHNRKIEGFSLFFFQRASVVIAS